MLHESFERQRGKEKYITVITRTCYMPRNDAGTTSSWSRGDDVDPLSTQTFDNNIFIHAEHVVHRRGYCFHFGCMYVCMFVCMLAL